MKKVKFHQCPRCNSFQTILTTPPYVIDGPDSDGGMNVISEMKCENCHFYFKNHLLTVYEGYSYSENNGIIHNFDKFGEKTGES